MLRYESGTLAAGSCYHFCRGRRLFERFFPSTTPCPCTLLCCLHMGSYFNPAAPRKIQACRFRRSTRRNLYICILYKLVSIYLYIYMYMFICLYVYVYNLYICMAGYTFSIPSGRRPGERLARPARRPGGRALRGMAPVQPTKNAGFIRGKWWNMGISWDLSMENGDFMGFIHGKWGFDGIYPWKKEI